MYVNIIYIVLFCIQTSTKREDVPFLIRIHANEYNITHEHYIIMNTRTEHVVKKIYIIYFIRRTRHRPLQITTMGDLCYYNIEELV